MNYQALFSDTGDRVVRVGLVGAGDFGKSLIKKIASIPRLELVLLCERNPKTLASVVETCGLDTSTVVVVQSLAEAGGGDPDVLVEATGHPQAGAANALWALERNCHVVMASKEAGIVVGPILQRIARDKGLVYSEVEGDQPSLLIGLVSWARSLGLDIVAAGKSSEYDFVLDADDRLHWRGKSIASSGLRSLWQGGTEGWSGLVAAREAAVGAAGLPLRTVPDFCEMGLVVNGTGLLPDSAELQAPLLRPTELADALQPASGGGIMESSGRIEVFNCLRRSDEASFAGGVFVVVACDDAETWELLADKGHVVSKNGRTAMLYNPQHLLGIEAPISILSAALLGKPTGAADSRPLVDLVARADRDWHAGERLEITDAHHHEVTGLSPLLVAATKLSDDNACPYYLATGARLRSDVRAGETITAGKLDLDRECPLWSLRRRQDRLFAVV